MKRLLIALNYYAPYVSGVAEYARYLAESLSRDVEVTVVCGLHDRRLAGEETINGVRVLRAPILFRLHKGYVSPALLALFCREAAKADVINIHLPMLEAGLLCKLSGERPVVCTYHCDLDSGGGWLNAAAVAAVRASAALVLRHATKVVVMTRDYADGSPYLAPYLAKLVEIVPPASRFYGRIPVTHQKCPDPVVGFVGRFVAEKGIDVLLRAVPMVAIEYPDVKFVLVGETKSVAGGTVFTQIESSLSALSDHVRVTGRVDDDELWRLLCSFDVLVLPSVNAYEAFGLVQIEAMLAGALVVASDLRGVRIPILRTGLGRLCPPGDERALAEAIATTLKERARVSRSEVGARALVHFGDTDFRTMYLNTLGMHPGNG